MRTVVDRAVDRHEVPADTDARLVLETLIAPLQFRTLVTRENFDHQYCRDLVQLIVDGISTRPVQKRRKEK
ncbi:MULTISPECIES: TetR-like C-terminal domain-containing protein [unclassified Mycolicibacterium]|uniref:TetR-like C-terminal domain-containing protein n=1 Tax=unclassified Mycolicibacterium TaxID=2636767 RepID=UPI0028150073|nr:MULTISPECIES: TetR-like C-terminal domain-containing protein [unclassified Mycolicibacterium]